MTNTIINTMRRLLTCTCMLCLLTNCTTAPINVAQITYPALAADAEGWYSYYTYTFKGTVQNRVPQGFGECNTRYEIANSTEFEWVHTPCEFNNGVRIDKYHLMRTEASLEKFRARRGQQKSDAQEEARELAAAYAYERAAAAESRAAFDSAYSAAATQIQLQAKENADALAQVDQQIEKTYAQVIEGQKLQADARQKQNADEEQFAKEQRQKQEQEQARREAEGKATQLAQQKKQEQIHKEAEEKAAKLAQQENDKRAKAQYLQQVASGSRLVATKCPDGEGKYYATGSRASIKPILVDCVDLYFKARCKDSVQYVSGVAHNFIGMSGCFGDTYDIIPKPDCPVEQIEIQITEAREGCG